MIAVLTTVLLQVAVVYQLVVWTMDDFRPLSLLRDQKAEQRRLEELAARPWRPWARLSMTSILIVGTLVLDGYLALRLSPMLDD